MPLSDDFVKALVGLGEVPAAVGSLPAALGLESSLRVKSTRTCRVSMSTPEPVPTPTRATEVCLALLGDARPRERLEPRSRVVLDLVYATAGTGWGVPVGQYSGVGRPWVLKLNRLE